MEQAQPAGEPASATGSDETAAPHPADTGQSRPDDRADGPRRVRTGRNLPAAVGVGVGLGAVVLAALYTVRQLFLIVVVAAVGVALWELRRALATRRIAVPIIPVAAAGLAMLIGAYLGGPTALCAALGIGLLVVLAWRLTGGADGYLRDAGTGVFTLLYLPFLAAFVVLTLAPQDGADRVLIFIAVTICSDIGGYFAGIFLGRHKLAPVISPKKTWEGSAGAIVACMACGGVLVPVLLHGHVWQGVLLGAAVMIAATCGDLIESVIKRDLGVKDMGTLLPGHGGIMDRLDSLLVAAPVVWLLLRVFVPSN